MKKRDRRLITPSSTSLTVGSDKSIQKGLDDLFDFCDAVPESMGPSEKVIDTSAVSCSQLKLITSSAFLSQGRRDVGK